MSTELAVYQEIEGRICKGRLDALLARWEFGRQLLAERVDGKRDKEGKRLPNGRREELSNALGISSSEIDHRMRFADRFPTEEEVRTAFQEYGSWYAICQKGIYGVPAQPPPDDPYHAKDYSAIRVAIDVLASRLVPFMEPESKEDIALRLVVVDRTLHRHEIATLRDVLFDLRWRVNVAINAVVKRMEVDVDEIDAVDGRIRVEQMRLNRDIERQHKRNQRMAARRSPPRSSRKVKAH